MEKSDGGKKGTSQPQELSKDQENTRNLQNRKICSKPLGEEARAEDTDENSNKRT